MPQQFPLGSRVPKFTHKGQLKAQLPSAALQNSNPSFLLPLSLFLCSSMLSSPCSFPTQGPGKTFVPRDQQTPGVVKTSKTKENGPTGQKITTETENRKGLTHSPGQCAARAEYRFRCEPLGGEGKLFSSHRKSFGNEGLEQRFEGRSG